VLRRAPQQAPSQGIAASTIRAIQSGTGSLTDKILKHCRGTGRRQAVVQYAPSVSRARAVPLNAARCRDQRTVTSLLCCLSRRQKGLRTANIEDRFWRTAPALRGSMIGIERQNVGRNHLDSTYPRSSIAESASHCPSNDAYLRGHVNWTHSS